MISPARVAAYDILVSVSSGRGDLPALIAASRSRIADDRDRALAADIATGVQRWRAALDHLIVHFAKRAIDRLDPEVVEILRMGVYQLIQLTRVPASAVVDDAVDLARRAHKRSATGFVNAVLRATSRGRGSLPLPARPGDPETDRRGAIEYLSVTLSHPRWLVERWVKRYGFESTEQWLQFDNQPAPLTLRANRLRTTPEELVTKLLANDVTVHRARYAPDGLIVEGGHPLRSAMASDGSFLVQDEASQLVPLLSGATAGQWILDTCASPGGKATALAAMAAPGGRIVACDVRDRRMALLQKTVAAAGADMVRLVRADLLRALPFSRRFDCVIVDAPCSGLGTLRRDPDIRWRRQEADLASLASAQLTMLRNAAEAVRPGGRLVYATCSSEPEENEDVADAFDGGAFRRIDVRHESMLDAALFDERGFFRTLPFAHGLEAFFGAVFVRHSP